MHLAASNMQSEKEVTFLKREVTIISKLFLNIETHSAQIVGKILGPTQESWRLLSCSLLRTIASQL